MSEEEDSNLVDQAADLNKAASTGPLNALLTPAFTVLGERLKKWVELSEKQRETNNKSHVEAVLKKNPNIQTSATPKKEADILEWAQEAGNYNSTDELSSLWRGVLDEILSSNQRQKIIIDYANQIDSIDLYIMYCLFVDNISDLTDKYEYKRIMARITRLSAIGLLNNGSGYDFMGDHGTDILTDYAKILVEKYIKYKK